MGHEDGEEGCARHHRKVLCAVDTGLPDQQARVRGGGYYSQQMSEEQDRRLHDASYEADSAGTGAWDFVETAGGGARAAHGFRAGRVCGGSGDEGDAALARHVQLAGHRRAAEQRGRLQAGRRREEALLSGECIAPMVPLSLSTHSSGVPVTSRCSSRLDTWRALENTAALLVKLSLLRALK